MRRGTALPTHSQGWPGAAGHLAEHRASRRRREPSCTRRRTLVRASHSPPTQDHRPRSLSSRARLAVCSRSALCRAVGTAACDTALVIAAAALACALARARDVAISKRVMSHHSARLDYAREHRTLAYRHAEKQLKSSRRPARRSLSSTHHRPHLSPPMYCVHAHTVGTDAHARVWDGVRKHTFHPAQRLCDAWSTEAFGADTPSTTLWHLVPDCETSTKHTHKRHDNVHTSGSLRHTRPDTASQSGPPTEGQPQSPPREGGAGLRMRSPSTAIVGGGAARPLLTARACWTMDSPRLCT